MRCLVVVCRDRLCGRAPPQPCDRVGLVAKRDSTHPTPQSHSLRFNHPWGLSPLILALGERDLCQGHGFLGESILLDEAI